MSLFLFSIEVRIHVVCLNMIGVVATVMRMHDRLDIWKGHAFSWRLKSSIARNEEG